LGSGAEVKLCNKNIGIITFPLSKSNIIPLSNYVDIFCNFSNNICLITGNVAKKDLFSLQDNDKLNVYTIKHSSGKNILTRIMNYAITQFKIVCKFIQLSSKTSVWIFPIGGEALLPSMMMAKLLKKKVILSLTSSTEKMVTAQDDVLGKVVIWFAKINYFLSDCIVLQSSKLIQEWDLEKYKNKIAIAHEHILNFDEFKIIKKYNTREILIAYIGRLSEEKGVLNFVKAISLIHNENDKCRFMIGGDGDLRVKIEKYLNENNLSDEVKLTGWISHDELPEYLNELKLIVLPSYTEGLPNIVLEAMACGTPVLATPVGAIPDIIKDGETGFILKDNSPECIAESVLKIIKLPDYELERVSKNARSLVEREFTLEKNIEKWETIFQDI